MSRWRGLIVATLTFFLMMALTAVDGKRLLGTFAKLRKETISFVMSCLSVCLSISPAFCLCMSVRLQPLGSHWTNFDEIWYVRISRKYIEKIHVSLEQGNSNGYFTWRPKYINPLNAELNPICHLLALLGAHLILHVSRVRVNDNIWLSSS